MATKSGASYTSQQDWSNYDFRTWDPGKVQAGATATFTGTALRNLVASPDWAANLATGVAGLKQSILPALTAYADNLQQKLQSLDDDLATATAAAQQQMSALQENVRATAAPPQPKSDPVAYQVAAKVVDKASKIGLPGVHVRVFDSRNPTVALASGTTDLAGNVVLKLAREHTDTAAGATAPKDSSITLEVLSPSGKAAFSAQLCPKLNQTETVLAGIESTPDLSPRLVLANLLVSQSQDLLRAIATHTEALTRQHAQAKSDLQDELQQVQAMIADLR